MILNLAISRVVKPLLPDFKDLPLLSMTFHDFKGQYDSDVILGQIYAFRACLLLHRRSTHDHANTCLIIHRVS